MPEIRQTFVSQLKTDCFIFFGIFQTTLAGLEF